MPKFENDKTITFSIRDEKEKEKEKETRAILATVYEALKEKGYAPVNQLVEYILSEDPTYITNHKNARSLIRRLDRYELLDALLKNYLSL